jgi:anaerobic glycerol-3-phosphate dehydrogenase
MIFNFKRAIIGGMFVASSGFTTPIPVQIQGQQVNLLPRGQVVLQANDRGLIDLSSLPVGDPSAMLRANGFVDVGMDGRESNGALFRSWTNTNQLDLEQSSNLAKRYAKINNLGTIDETKVSKNWVNAFLQHIFTIAVFTEKGQKTTYVHAQDIANTTALFQGLVA